MKHSNLIAKYIQHKLTPEEQEEVKRLLEEDEDFKKEVSFQLTLQAAIKQEEGAEIKEYLKQVDKNEKSTNIFSVVWKVAAVLVLGVGLFWFFNQPLDYDKIYAENFKPYPNVVVPTVRGDNTADKSDVKKAFNAYDNRDYANAAEALKKLYIQDKEVYFNFYYGISLMADNQTTEAIKVLENQNWEASKILQEQVDWYIALGYLKLQDKTNAITYLEKVKAGKASRAAQAQKILKAIK
ncbi:hypothetical protein GGR32_000648 [Mesonia hippocampi]|uniref:Tetratricopeptide repeat protein n=1 Tax=Mesonia hippocampi TaxID=1628250 RepID=A0A840EWC8_9FLAO|nr:hypothetical protein [Mesonia hippocampi]MBB4118374.1 hypothetical protein [Mesonia hippocampi]